MGIQATLPQTQGQIPHAGRAPEDRLEGRVPVPRLLERRMCSFGGKRESQRPRATPVLLMTEQPMR